MFLIYFTPFMSFCDFHTQKWTWNCSGLDGLMDDTSDHQSLNQTQLIICTMEVPNLFRTVDELFTIFTQKKGQDSFGH